MLIHLPSDKPPEEIWLEFDYSDRYNVFAFKQLFDHLAEGCFTLRTEECWRKPPAGMRVISCKASSLKEKVRAREVTLNDYQGVVTDGYLFLSPLANMHKVNAWKFLTSRYVKKFLFPERYYTPTQFTWELVDSSFLERVEAFLRSCLLQAWDIEHLGRDCLIDCVGISGMSPKGEVATFVFDLTRVDLHPILLPALQRIAQGNAIKITQNGQYDNTYFIRYSILLKNWLLDTKALFHAWYAELPKKLSNIAAFTLVGVQFWKDEIASGDRFLYLRYNAKDAWVTLHAAISMLLEMPPFARKNYSISFPKTFWCLHMGMTGLLVDKAKKEELRKQIMEEQASSLEGLRTMLAAPSFNPNSPKQVKLVFALYGSGDLTSTDKTNQELFAFRHPVNARLIEAIRQYRRCSKALSAYLDKPLWDGNRILYFLDPSHTETGRLSCRESALSGNINYGTGKKAQWKNIGFQVQNISPVVKKMIRAPEGFKLMEFDGKAMESRCTGYLAQETTLIDRVENSPDFHCANASDFFQMPFEELWDVEVGKVLNKAIRDISKPVNHGCNYNMACAVLVATMGEQAVYQAGEFLGMHHATVMEIAQVLINRFCLTYPRLKGTSYSKVSHAKGVKYLFSENTYYGELIHQIETSGVLTSPYGWTRFCFGNPRASKRDLNMYVAHPSQNLGAAYLDRGILRCYNDPIFRRWLFQGHVLIHAQIHDSFLISVRDIMVKAVAKKVEELLDETVEIHGRKMRIPFDASEPATFWKG